MAEVGAISKAQKGQSIQNCKRGEPFGLLKLQFVAKYEKNEGGNFGDCSKIFLIFFSKFLKGSSVF